MLNTEFQEGTKASINVIINGEHVETTLGGNPIAILTGLVGAITHFAKVLESDPTELAFQIADTMKKHESGEVNE